MKDKTTAYIIWFFLGVLGGHKFYLGNIIMGVIYFFTGGLFFIGWVLDAFTLGSKVDDHNLKNALLRGGGGFGAQQSQNVVVTVNTPQTQNQAQTQATITISPEKKILKLAKENDILTFKEIITSTDLEIEEAEIALQKIVSKGLAEKLNVNDIVKYDFK